MQYKYDKPDCSCVKDLVKYVKEGYSPDMYTLNRNFIIEDANTLYSLLVFEDQNDLGIKFLIGECSESANFGLPENFDKAMGTYHDLAELGYAPALYRIGEYLELGITSKREAPKKALPYYLKAAELDYAPALNGLGRIYWDSDREKAIEYFKKAIKLGYVRANYDLGMRYIWSEQFDKAIEVLIGANDKCQYCKSALANLYEECQRTNKKMLVQIIESYFNRING